MNYLAHLFLSSRSPADIAGALLGDFAKGDTPQRYGLPVRRAIARHRAIDRYTDGHPLVHASRALVSPVRRRFAPILIDVFYDHFLVRYWPRFSSRPLDAFTGHVYGVLRTQQHWYPARLQRMVPHMISGDWLSAYGDRRGVAAALDGIARRLSRFSRASVLRDAVEELDRDYGAMAQQFLDFFPQLIRWLDGPPAAAARHRRPDVAF